MSPITPQAQVAGIRALRKKRIQRWHWVGGPAGRIIEPTPAIHMPLWMPVGDAEYVEPDTASLADIAHVNSLAASEHFEVGIGWVT
jgi:hypothetical protein